MRRFDVFEITIKQLDDLGFSIDHSGIYSESGVHTLIVGSIPNLAKTLQKLCGTLNENQNKQIDALLQIVENHLLAPAVRKSAEEELKRYAKHYSDDKELSRKICAATKK